MKVFPVLHQDGLEQDLNRWKIRTDQFLSVAGAQCGGAAEFRHQIFGSVRPDRLPLHVEIVRYKCFAVDGAKRYTKPSRIALFSNIIII